MGIEQKREKQQQIRNDFFGNINGYCKGLKKAPFQEPLKIPIKTLTVTGVG